MLRPTSELSQVIHHKATFQERGKRRLCLVFMDKCSDGVTGSTERCRSHSSHLHMLMPLVCVHRFANHVSEAPPTTHRLTSEEMVMILRIVHGRGPANIIATADEHARNGVESSWRSSAPALLVDAAAT